MGGAGPSGADKWSTSNWSSADQWSTPGEDQGAAEAVGAAGHPAEVAQGGAAGRLVGEGLAVAGEGVDLAREVLASGSVEARSSQLLVRKLAPASWRNTVHSRRENNLVMMMMMTMMMMTMMMMTMMIVMMMEKNLSEVIHRKASDQGESCFSG